MFPSFLPANLYTYFLYFFLNLTLVLFCYSGVIFHFEEIRTCLLPKKASDSNFPKSAFSYLTFPHKSKHVENSVSNTMKVRVFLLLSSNILQLLLYLVSNMESSQASCVLLMQIAQSWLADSCCRSGVTAETLGKLPTNPESLVNTFLSTFNF